ncbi:MAG: carboxypeptidase-like regulatory domain-containing protein [Deferribacteraceae bacterium]|jgi:hypothetical protein|nr:carboxypeptidase-like regulatory domain-containing protein [Deferribacteraceae bacterium]
MKKLKCLSCALLIFSVLVGCGSSVDDDNRGTPNNNGDGRQHGIVPVEYRGQWVYVHNAQEVFLGAYTNLTLEYTDGNIITVKNQNSADRHLIRANSSDVRLHGTVEGLASVSAQSSGNRLMAIGGMNLIARNLTDPNINGQAKTDTDGNYSIDDLPNGSYEVIVDNNTVKTDLIDSDNDLGIITVINDNGCNFKSSVKMDNRFIYGDYTAYNGNVIIQNIGRAECTGLEYTISTTNTYVDNFTFTRTPGTLLPDRSINIPIKVSFKYIDESEKYIPFIIEMRDVRGRVWNDRLRLKVYRSGLTVNFDSQRQVRGQIIVPGQNAVRINSAKTGVTLPEMPGKEYLIVLSNPDDLAYETYYSVGVNTSANNPNSITDNVDKGNNRTDTAKVLNLGGKTDGFLYRGAIHTFKIVMDSGISHKAVDLFVDKMGVFYDTVGNNDGILNKGETARFDIGIHNSGLSTANRVLTTLSVTDPYITITKGSSSYCSNPNIGGGKTVDTSYYGRDSTHFSYLSNGSSNACFQVSVLNTAPDNHIATVTATMTDQFYNVWTDTFNISVLP